MKYHKNITPELMALISIVDKNKKFLVPRTNTITELMALINIVDKNPKFLVPKRTSVPFSPRD